MACICHQIAVRIASHHNQLAEISASHRNQLTWPASACRLILGVGVRRTQCQEILVAVCPLQARLALKQILRDSGEQDPRLHVRPLLGVPPCLGLRKLGFVFGFGVPLTMAVHEDGARDGARDGASDGRCQ